MIFNSASSIYKVGCSGVASRHLAAPRVSLFAMDHGVSSSFSLSSSHVWVVGEQRWWLDSDDIAVESTNVGNTLSRCDDGQPDFATDI